jgi:hypothetical protein
MQLFPLREEITPITVVTIQFLLTYVQRAIKKSRSKKSGRTYTNKIQKQGNLNNKNDLIKRARVITEK